MGSSTAVRVFMLAFIVITPIVAMVQCRDNIQVMLNWEFAATDDEDWTNCTDTSYCFVSATTTLDEDKQEMVRSEVSKLTN